MDHGGVSDPQLEIKFRQQSLEPASLPAGFHSHTNLHPLCRQITVEFLSFLAVLQSPLSAVAGGDVHKSNLLEGRVIIASYNQHIGSFLPSLFGWLCTTKAYSGLRSRHCHGINYTQVPQRKAMMSVIAMLRQLRKRIASEMEIPDKRIVN